MKKLVFVILVSIILAGCFTVGPKGELQLDAVTLIGKLNEDAQIVK